jgi:AraC family transcriptional regulator
MSHAFDLSFDAQKVHVYAWPERFLYLGPSTATTLHRNHAATWLVAERGKLRVTIDGGESLEDEVVYVPSETPFRTEDAHTLIAALYWEPESASFQRIAAQFDVRTPRAFACQFTSASRLIALTDPDTSLATADRTLASVFGLETFGLATPTVADERIANALNFLRADPRAYDSIDALAARVHLSPSRFAHVFKEHVGVPVRRYVLWLKMRAALDAAIDGQSLTAAAISAGFADSAHLSRTVRALIGVAPEFLFRRRERLVIHR